MQFKNRSHKSLFVDISVHSNVHGSKYLCRKILYFRHPKWVFNEGLQIRKKLRIVSLATKTITLETKNGDKYI